ncbi:hypothetical protein E2C01_068614 [Portunus trituberculatus]|uniref:Uncharacterized protein n=1 Tax=Portunus trituberculatus TaxID=210409 RepID=A0A5B7HPA2_PORTR|nr:hypothetical protein [Portunus trituberculatus]
MFVKTRHAPSLKETLTATSHPLPLARHNHTSPTPNSSYTPKDAFCCNTPPEHLQLRVTRYDLHPTTPSPNAPLHTTVTHKYV